MVLRNIAICAKYRMGGLREAAVLPCVCCMPLGMGWKKCDVPGLHDFESIQTSLDLFEREALGKIDTLLPDKTTMIGSMLNALLETYVRDRVYILTSFIEAHNYAQRITIKYLGEKGIVDTEEEALIIAESNQLMKEARKMLAEIDIDVISFHATGDGDTNGATYGKRYGYAVSRRRNLVGKGYRGLLREILGRSGTFT